ncbi:serine hydrolase domain-containing protein [Kordiimonas aestuarii]|uniref:serine hydrolase domain-containing protein n=1 Tax=Kordiimonas aestuarii TaxID=1005925 RepID=UPI0021CF0354|nr:serine hydrolase domain-containing protein [Kordiimonas aestuarii]
MIRTLRPLLAAATLAITGLSVAAHDQGAREASAPYQMPDDKELTDLHAAFADTLEKNNIPGGLIAVYQNGKILHLKPFGLANVELDVPVSDDSVFEIGSISKQFATATVMMLAEEGRLDVGDPISKYLNYLPSEWTAVTIKQLMQHQSGIPDYEEIRSYDVYRYRLTPEEVIRIGHSRPMDFTPGTGYYYSNTGYYLLSMIIERVEGKPLREVFQARIFKPLGMTQTRFADPAAIIKHRAEGYWENKVGELINRNPTEYSSTLAAGGLLTSAADMARWDAALNGTTLLSAKAKAEMWTSGTLPDGSETGYGYGWDVTPYDDNHKTRSHTGQVGGFTSVYMRFPEQGISTMLFVNRYRARGIRDVNNKFVNTFLHIEETETKP